MSAHVRAVGLHCERKNLYVVDLDGKAAVDHVKEKGCDPLGPDIGWRIYRVDDEGTSVVYRWKIPFILTPEQQDLLGRTKFSLVLIPADKEKGIKQEAVEFLGHHCQAVALGVHPEGGGYRWSGHPDRIATLPDNWFQMLVEAKAKVEAKKAANKPAGRVTDGTQRELPWESPKPKCWICGRPGTGLKSGDCRSARRSDGRLEVHCSQGQTYAPPKGLSPGDVIKGNDDQKWAYVGEKPNGLGDGRLFSIFVIHQPKVMNTPVRTINSAVPALHVAEAPEERGITLSQLLPLDIANALKEVTKHLPYDEHVVGMNYLAGISGLVKLGTLICGNQITSYNVPPNLYIATVGRSGQKKTPLHQLTIRKPAINLLSQVADINRELFEEWIAACKDAKEDGRDKPKPPPRVSIHVSDYTGEALNALLSVLEGKKRGLLLTRDEISGLLCSMNAYRKGLGADAQQLLEIYDGHASNAIRISGDRSYERCHVSIQGNIQPEVLRDLVKTGDPDGRWARFMFLPMREMTCPLPTQVNEETIDAVRSAETVLQTYASRVFHLEPATYELDQSAIEAFCRYGHQAQPGNL
ncbi:DUF3987 domain-containing protein [Synechococcus sp. RedBA-s]|uniref:DUF3987 domain-containing protein n=1 Tax=Synechococcus sp. RedBA-s TaxID=2823741 RepID=UPI0020CC5217|nr:DUF3987 domain-containing protein [Synechococcus sp. RedBA-s]